MDTLRELYRINTEYGVFLMNGNTWLADTFLWPLALTKFPGQVDSSVSLDKIFLVSIFCILQRTTCTFLINCLVSWKNTVNGFTHSTLDGKSGEL